MTQASRPRRKHWQPAWLATLLCLFLIAAPAKAHEATAQAMAFATQPAVSSALDGGHDSCPGDTGHGQHRCCTGQGLCHVVAIVQDTSIASITIRETPAPRRSVRRAGGNVAPLFHPPRSQLRS